MTMKLAMAQSTSISVPIIAVRTEDTELLAWLSNCLEVPVSSEVTLDSRFVIYGQDHGQFLSLDNHNQKLTHCRAALCLTSQVDVSYLDLYRHNVCHVIYRNEPFAGEALRLAILTTGPQKALIACSNFHEFQSPPEIIETLEFPVISSDVSKSFQAPVMDFFARNPFPEEVVQAVCLCLKEAITNAIFHGFREEGTHNRKYTPETFHGLYDNDYVAVNLTLTPAWLSVRVWDNSGSLGPLSVANSLDRHIFNQGLMDSRGRGFYLMQKLAQRLVVCIRRRQETSIQMYFLRKRAPQNALRHLEVIAL